MANGTLKVQNIETSSGSGTITLGQSGETITLGGSSVSNFGKVAQVVQASTSTGKTLTSTTLTDTGLSASITPSSTTSKILVLGMQGFGKSANNVQIDATLVRDSTTIVSSWLNDVVYTNSSLLLYLAPAALVYLDSPASTSEVTYKTQFRNAANTNAVYANVNNSTSVMTLMEILG